MISKCLRMICMKLWMVILIPIYLCTTTSARADGVFLEGGQGFFRSADSRAIFLSYQIDTPSIFGINTFCKGELGSWNGQNSNNAVVLALGLLWNLPRKSYICFEPGGAYITKTTDNLGTHLQFALRFAMGMKFDKIDLSVGYKHFSNGDGILNWTDTPNYGENFITLQIGYLL
jgi:hypothetical protein